MGFHRTYRRSGFVFSIFSVGFLGWSALFNVLRADGFKYLSLAVVIAVAGFTLAVVGAKLLNFPPGVSAGLLFGSLIGSPTLAAAQGGSAIAELFRRQQGSLPKR